MKTCDEFEMAVDMRLHGALGWPQAVELDAHLAGCANCRDFEASAREAERALSGHAVAAAAPVDWGAAETRIRRDLRHESRIGVGVLVVLLLGQFVRAAAGGQLGLLSVLLGVICALAVGGMFLRRRLLARALEREGDLFEWMRRRIARNRWYARWMSWLLLLGGVLPFALAPGRHPAPHWLALAANALAYFAVLAYVQLVLVPALGRELSALERR